MTDTAGTPENTELDPEHTPDPTAEVSQKAGEEGAPVDYQTRMEQFEETETDVPVTSFPTESRPVGKSDLEM